MSTKKKRKMSATHIIIPLMRRKDMMTGLEAEKVSKISLVDLAGSERAKDTAWSRRQATAGMYLHVQVQCSPQDFFKG